MENKKKIKISEELLKLAAEQYLENQGEKLLKTFKGKNAVDPTEKQVKTFRKLCNRELKKKDRKVSIPYKVAVAAAAILIIFNMSIISVPAVKQVVVNFLMKSGKTHTTIYIDNKERNTVEDSTNYRLLMEEEYTITYLPEELYIVKEERTSRTITRRYENSDDDSQMIIFSQENDGATINLDTENAIVDYVDINGINALLSQKGDTINIIWRTDKYYISITSQNIEKDELIKIAKSVKK